MSADQLCDALWGERPPASAAKILQGCVVRIRKLLGREAVQTSPHGYVLQLPSDALDSTRFEGQVSRARELLTLGEADRAAYLLTDALALWHGEAFADLENWEPAVAAGTRLSELRLEAEELRVDAVLRAGRYREVLSEAQVLVRAAPLREHRWVLLARAQYQSGQQGEALRTIHQLKGVLAEHLGIDPGPDVVALEMSILRQDTSLLVADAPAPSATCPWLGLGRTASRTPTGSSAGTTTWPPALRSWRGPRCSPWSVPRARASPRCSGPGWRQPCDVAGNPV